MRRRKAEAEDELRKKRLAAELHQRRLAAKQVRAERGAAVAELKKQKTISDYENIRETKHAMKTFTVDLLGQGSSNAGGPRGKKHRPEVLDRMARIGAGLSPSQRNL